MFMEGILFLVELWTLLSRGNVHLDNISSCSSTFFSFTSFWAERKKYLFDGWMMYLNFIANSTLNFTWFLQIGTNFVMCFQMLNTYIITLYSIFMVSIVVLIVNDILQWHIAWISAVVLITFSHFCENRHWNLKVN